MAFRTGETAPAGIGVERVDRGGQFGVALPTGHLGDLVVPGGDAHGIRITAGRKVKRMPEPVLRFRHVLRDRARRRVAVVTDRHRAVAGACPRVEMIPHDMAVRACFRVIRKVGVAFRIDEGISAYADREPDQDCGDDQQP